MVPFQSVLPQPSSLPCACRRRLPSAVLLQTKNFAGDDIETQTEQVEFTPHACQFLGNADKRFLSALQFFLAAD
jgi:hypothetical protein